MRRVLLMCCLSVPMALRTMAVGDAPAAPPAPPSPEKDAPAEAEAEEPAPEIGLTGEAQAYEAKFRAAAEALQKREAFLLASNETVRAIVQRRDQFHAEREAIIAQLPEVVAQQEAVDKALAEMNEAKKAADAGAEGGADRLRQARMTLFQEKRKLRQLQYGVGIQDSRLGSLLTKANEAGRELTTALSKDPEYAALFRERNRMMVRFHRRTMPPPETDPKLAEQAAREALEKPVGTETPVLPPPPLPPGAIPEAPKGPKAPPAPPG